jgi:hypothetical protein
MDAYAPMTNRPELVIGYDEDTRPVAGVCSACGEIIYEDKSRTEGALDIIRRLSALFRLHIQHKHMEVESERVY